MAPRGTSLVPADAHRWGGLCPSTLAAPRYFGSTARTGITFFVAGFFLRIVLSSGLRCLEPPKPRLTDIVAGANDQIPSTIARPLARFIGQALATDAGQDSRCNYFLPATSKTGSPFLNLVDSGMLYDHGC